MGKGLKKTIVISGINFISGGPLSIMKDCLNAVSDEILNQYEVIALVNSKSMFKEYSSRIKILEFPKSKKSWFFRLYYEFIYFKRLSKQLKVDHWMSMHDITPNVSSVNQYVYCHNPSPFYKSSFKELFISPKVFLFSKFYKYLYAINITKNKYVIVQQEWLREEFKKKWKIRNILVAYPEIQKVKPLLDLEYKKTEKTIFFYPSFPRLFKNFEIICEAYEQLPETYKNKCEIVLTISANLNKYSASICDRYKNEKGIQFLGLLERSEVFSWYNKADFLIFPSKLETWGLPITEFKNFDKPILLSDLPYAHETIGVYDKAAFFDPASSKELAELMKKSIDGTIKYKKPVNKRVEKPFVTGWNDFFKYLLKNDN